MEDLLNTSILELIYNDTDPPTHKYHHFTGAQTTSYRLLVFSDISANTNRIILDDLGSENKPAIAKTSLTRQQRTLDSYIRTSELQKGWLGKIHRFVRNKPTPRKYTFHSIQIRLTKLWTAAPLTALNLESQEEEWTDTNASGSTTLKLSRTNENTWEKELNKLAEQKTSRPGEDKQLC